MPVNFPWRLKEKSTVTGHTWPATGDWPEQIPVAVVGPIHLRTLGQFKEMTAVPEQVQQIDGSVISSQYAQTHTDTDTDYVISSLCIRAWTFLLSARQTDGWMDKQTDRHTHRWTNRQTNIFEKKDEKTGRQAGRQTDMFLTHTWINRQTCFRKTDRTGWQTCFWHRDEQIGRPILNRQTNRPADTDRCLRISYLGYNTSSKHGLIWQL